MFTAAAPSRLFPLPNPPALGDPMLRPHRLTLLTALSLLAMAQTALAGILADVDRAIRSAQLKGATVGVSIRDTQSGVELVNVNSRQPFIPASNMKLLTTGAALHLLGPEFHFNTRLLLDGDRLIVAGDGDPAFGDPELLDLMTIGEVTGVDFETFLDIWIDAVREAGVTHLREVVVDDRIFDREFVHPGWPADQLNRRYCAQVAGFNFHLNVLHFYPETRPSGRPDISRFVPYASWLEISNSGTCQRGKNESNTAWIARQIGTNRLKFYGNVRYDYRIPVPVTLDDPPSFFARLLADRLSDAGVRVDGWSVPAVTDPPSEGVLIDPVVSTPISTAVLRCNRDSQNLYAEALLKRCGGMMTEQPGSWTNGGAILRHALHERLGDPSLTASVTFADGSGLARGNRVSPETMTAWLNSFHDDPRLGDLFIASLATPGDSGTLQRRFRDAALDGVQVAAKSGYINEVSCLSGYVTASNGRRYTFSVLVNDLPDTAAVRQAKWLQEEIVQIIASELTAAPVQLGSD